MVRLHRLFWHNLSLSAGNIGLLAVLSIGTLFIVSLIGVMVSGIKIEPKETKEIQASSEIGEISHDNVSEETSEEQNNEEKVIEESKDEDVFESNVLGTAIQSVKQAVGEVAGITTVSNTNLQQAYQLKNGITVPKGKLLYVNLTSNASKFVVQDNGADVFRVDSDKNVIIHPGASLYLLGDIKDGQGNKGQDGQVLIGQSNKAPKWEYYRNLTAGGVQCEGCITGTQLADTIEGNFTIQGTIKPGLSQGSLVFIDQEALSQDNSSLYWDTTNKRLGIGTNTPSSKLVVQGGDVKIGSGTFDNATAGDDLYVTGNIETDGTIYGNISGTITPGGFTQGSVVFANSSGALAQDNSNFFWDDTNNRLGIGLTDPISSLEIASANSIATSTLKDTLTLTDTTSNSSNIAGGGSGIRFRGHTGFGSATLAGIWAETEGANTDGSLFFMTSGSSGSLSPDMVIKSTGNVGIGTTSPVGTGTTTLTISGNSTTAAGNYGSLALRNPSANTQFTWGSLDFYGSTAIGAAIRAASTQGGTNYGTLDFYVNNAGTLEKSATLDHASLTLGLANGTVSRDLRVYNNSAAANKIGIKLGNMQTSANSNIEMQFVDYLQDPYAAIRGVYNGSVQDGQIAFLTGNGGTPAEVMRITDTGSVGINKSSSLDGMLHVQTSAAATKGLIVQGAASQSGNLQEWQNSSGTALASISSNASVFDLPASSSIGDNGNVGGQIAFSTASVGIRPTSLSSDIATVGISGFTVAGAAGGSAAILTVNRNDSVAAGFPIIDAQESGTSRFKVDVKGTGTFTIGAASSKGVIIKGASSQTGNLQEWQNSSGTALALITSGGAGLLGANVTSYQGAAQLEVYNSTTNSNIYASNTKTSGTNIAVNGTSGGSGATLNIGGYFWAQNGTSNYGIQIPTGLVAGANNYAIYADSAAKSYFAGDVGIGTTSPNTKLDVRSTSMILRSNVVGNSVAFNLQNSDGTTIGSVSTDNNLKLILDGYNVGGVHIPVGLSVGSGLAASNPPTGGIVVTGNVGIGEAAPGSKLAVSGGATVGASYDTTAAPTNGLLVEGSVGIGVSNPASNVSVQIGIGNTRQILLNRSEIGTSVNDGTYMGTGTSGSFEIVNQESGFMRFYTNGVEMLRLDSDGEVGIRDDTPDAALEVVNDGSGDSFLVADTNDGDTTPFVIQSDGDVGIGTASPGYKLEVNGTIHSNDSGGVAYSLNGGSAIRTVTTGNIYIDTKATDGGDIYFRPRVTNAMVLTSNTNLGLGTITFGTSAAKVLAIGNGTAPSTSPADSIQLYAEDVAASSELKVRDEAGNITTLSPHNFSLFTPETHTDVVIPWSFYSKNDNYHQEINVDMYGAVETLQALTGTQFIFAKNTETGEDLNTFATFTTLPKPLQDLLPETAAFKDLDLQLKALTDRVAKLEANQPRPQVLGTTTETTTPISPITAAVQVNGQAVTFLDNVTFNKDLTLLGSLIADSINIANALSVHGDTTLMGNLLVEGELTLSSKQVGSFKLPSGSKAANITYEKPFSSNARDIVVSAVLEGGFGNHTITKKTVNGFTLELEAPNTTDIIVSWTATIAKSGSAEKVEIIKADTESAIPTQEEPAQEVPTPATFEEVPVSEIAPQTSSEAPNIPDQASVIEQPVNPDLGG